VAVILELPAKLAATLRLTPEKLKIDAAAGLYAGGGATLGQAAELAGISQTDFLHELGKRGICLNYSREDLEHDLKMVDVLLDKMKRE
jgi:predicted HTH domain antitoxin